MALAAAVIAGMFVAPSLAVAAPAADPAPDPAVQPTTGPTGLEAPDIASAKTIAALQGERVEVIGERTVTSSTWVNPDGTLTTGQAQAPIWVQTDGDGTATTDWAPVDLTLKARADGTVAPKAAPTGLVLAGAGVPADGRLLSMDGPDEQSVGMDWTSKLPSPRLAGPRAVYDQVQPGVDLVVEATRTGYEQYFVLTERPAADAVPDLQLTVTAEGLAATSTDDGGVAFTSASGDVVASTTTPQVWDAGVDDERLHPIAQPWTPAEAPTALALAPTPDWGTEPADQPSADEPNPSMDPVDLGVPTELPLPAGSDTEATDSAGQVDSDASAKAGASTLLPLTESVEITAPDTVDFSLTPDPAYLADPDTQYPVVVDPDNDFSWGFDTFVQTGFGTDQSGSTELRLGTYDGGGTVARSFINWDLSSIRHKHIFSAQLYLWEWYSWSCTPANWQVWDTQLANNSTRINNQPGWVGLRATSSQTRGYSSNCGEGWVSADVTGLVQAWSNGGYGMVGTGLKAENETDNNGWKKFNAADAYSAVPTLYVHWNNPPGPATGLTVSPKADNGGWWTNSTTPRLSATVHDEDGVGNMNFILCREINSECIWAQNINGIADGHVGSVDVPPGLLTNGERYYFWVRSHDGVNWNTQNSANSPVFTVDTTAPAVPRISSTDYPSDGTWHGGEGRPGQFLLSMPTPDPTLAGYEWGLDTVPSTSGVAATGDFSLPVTPTTQGVHVLQVRSVDKAGNRSGVAKYAFNVGRAGLVSPVDGAQVVRRVRLDVTGESAFTHVRFNWRRGPDSAVTTPIALSTLTASDGAPLTGTWTSLASVGDYVSWNAGLTLGDVPGPIQVQAVVATDGNGGGAYASGWVTVTVSPDADGAATDTVGPGAVNLLTGDYQLSSTDVDEFGVALARTTSSRDPRAGFQPQAEKLPPTQQAMSATTGISGNSAAVSVVTDRYHSGKNSLRVVTTGGDSDSFAYLPDVTLPRGGTYRITGWVYVPAATGLSPESGAGLKLFGYYQDSAGNWPNAMSAKPALTDAWQQLSLDITVPASAQQDAKVRLYAGFAAAGKEVFFDDLSVRELWAPLGPQWSLGTVDEAAGTAYTYLSQPYPDVAVLHLTGGGDIGFTAAGDGRWWPEPGAEDLTLTQTGPGQWKVTELDGTVSTFATASTGVLSPNTSLGSNQSMTSSSGNFRLSMQGDGNLVLYRARDNAPLWYSGTSVAGSYLVMQGDGNLVVYGPNAAPVWYTSTSGNPGAQLIMQNDGNLVVYAVDGRALWSSGTYGNYSAEDHAQLLTTSPPAGAGKTRHLHQNVNGRLRLSRIIAPIEPDVDGWPGNAAACTGAVPAAGCEVTELMYATGGTPASTTATSFGNYADRLVEVRLWSTAAPGASATDAVSAVRYAYDNQGRLREAWDPRITPSSLKTTYSYDADGRVAEMGTPGELPWTFRYGSGGANSTVGNGDLLDRSSGRLLSVSRDSLLPGTLDQVGPDTTSTVVYNVPTTRSAGGPYDLDPAALATWAQKQGPTDATAVFGPEDVPPVTTATASTPGADGYKAATVHYLDASGREVNTATPPGPGAPAAGFIDTAEYDRYGNVIRTLDATNRLLALGLLPSAAADLAALNLTQTDTPARAIALSTTNEFFHGGVDLKKTRGPLVRLAVGNDPSDVRLVFDVTTYTYDENSPDGAAYHLVTTQTDALLIAGSLPERFTDTDTEVTRTGYDPIDGALRLGPTSGWKTGQPTVTTFDATGANLSAYVRYDAQGRAVESRGIGASGSDARTNLALYYTAGIHPQDNQRCGNKPAYAGLPCVNKVAGAVTGHDSGRMAEWLPVKHVSEYNRYGSVVKVAESASGPVNGAPTPLSRETVTEYDAADRVMSVAVTPSDAGAGAPVSKTVNEYDPATGDVTVIKGVDPAGAVTSTVKKSFDRLGRMTRYEDGNGGWTTSVFDQFGKPTQVADSTGSTTSFTYDRAVEPRGLLTSVTDSVGGTISASYGPDGQVMQQSLPGGVELRIGYDANRTPTSRTYVRTSDGVVISQSAALENSSGQMVTHATPAASKRYNYDALGRLTNVQDSISGTSLCVARTYGYDPRGNRTSLTTTAASGTATCADPANPAGAAVTTSTYTHDSADRLVGRVGN